ncbi:MAG: sialate O-acetylesterase [Fibromonadaceae bacterium]|jgi:hypothetical protein|nr:sialate O-acetylesterase [Fibromonadaceae bacterium]
MKRYLVFSAIFSSLLVFACSSKSNNTEEEPLSSSSEVVVLSSSSSEAVSSSSEEVVSSSSEEISSSSSEILASSSSSVAASSSSSVRSSSSVVRSSSSVAVSSSSSVKSSSSSSVAVSSSSLVEIYQKENFHIYLAFGQSNMEGQCSQSNSVVYNDVLPDSYKENVDSRFQVMTAVAGNYKLAKNGSQNREQGKWYTAVPPLVRNNLCLSPVDYFGRTIVANTPSNINVGIIVVAVGGAAIEGFGKTGSESYYSSQESWMKAYAANYGNNPYKRLVDLAKEAQKVGVIKGILMHQGESGAANGNYSQKVKAIYDNILADLGLSANSIPFIAGQAYGNNNSNISSIPNAMGKMPNGENVGYVISSQGLTAVSDNLHFTYEGYKTLGERYGQKMLELLYSK